MFRILKVSFLVVFSLSVGFANGESGETKVLESVRDWCLSEGALRSEFHNENREPRTEKYITTA
jgi:hypothetical protein